MTAAAWRLFAARPTMGESLLISCRAARVWAWVSTAAAFLTREKRAAESNAAAALFSAENRKWALSGNTSKNSSKLKKRSSDQETERRGWEKKRTHGRMRRRLRRASG